MIATAIVPAKITAKTDGDYQFYPTPPELVRQLIAPYKGREGTVLEPSAGKGDIADALKGIYRLKVSCCEVSPELRAILMDKGHRVIGTDFLKFDVPYLFDFVVMNPPFINCDDHFVKAWSVLDAGGSMSCILPESALKKKTGMFKEMNRLIEEFGEVEKIGNPFKKAERATDVVCVIVRLKKPKNSAPGFEPFKGYNPKQDETYTDPVEHDLPAPRDLVKAIVAQYRAALQALKIAHDAETTFRRTIPSGTLMSEYNRPEYSERVDAVKEAFWNLIFERTRIGEVTTSGYREKFMKTRKQLQMMEFSEETIYEVLHLFMANKTEILHDCVMDVFKNATNYSQDHTNEDLRWKTNKGWKINKKIIIPWAVDGGFYFTHNRKDFVNDLDKVLSLFGGKNGICSMQAIDGALRDVRSGARNYTLPIETPNFTVHVYKKGTVHLLFKDLKSLEMINRYAAEHGLNIIGSGK